MNAPNFEVVTARAGHECRGGLLVGLGAKTPESEFLKMFYPGAVSATNQSDRSPERGLRNGCKENPRARLSRSLGS